MKEYFGEGWKEILAANELADFEKIWNLKADWFEEPNIRRGGWSGVARVELNLNDGEKAGVFLKRQENHITKTLCHPIKGIPTFEREYQNILRFRKCHLATVEPVYFGKRVVDGKVQAILMTKALDDYRSLDSKAMARDSEILKDNADRERLLRDVADAMRAMHKSHFQHNCFYLKHIFVKPLPNRWDIKIIDLEKLKWRPFKRHAVLRDLYTLHRHASGWSRADRLRFLRLYMQEQRLSPQSKAIWRAIRKKIESKQKD